VLVKTLGPLQTAALPKNSLVPPTIVALLLMSHAIGPSAEGGTASSFVVHCLVTTRNPRPKDAVIA